MVFALPLQSIANPIVDAELSLALEILCVWCVCVCVDLTFF